MILYISVIIVIKYNKNNSYHRLVTYVTFIVIILYDTEKDIEDSETSDIIIIS